MAQLRRPGSYVDEVLNPPPVIQGDFVDDTAVGAFVGTNPRGPITATYCATWGQYLDRFGSFSSNFALPYAVYAYFANGGRGTWVARVVGAGAAAAAVTINDRAGVPAGQLTVTADSPGAWGNALFVSVSDSGGATSGRFNLEVLLGGTASSNLVERHTDLSMDPADRRYAPAVVNRTDGIEGGSNYVTLTKLGTLNTAPAVTTNAALIGGADGAAVGSAELIAAQTRLNEIDRPLVVNLPGVSDAPTLNSYGAWAEARQDAFMVYDLGVGLTAAQAITAANALTTTSYAAAYYPWINVSDPGSANPGTTRLVPPGGSVVGRYVSTDSTRGVHKAPAGIDNRIAGAVSTERRLTNTELDDLNVAPVPVNAIRQLPGAGICIMGARTLRQGRADKYVPTRRTLIYLRRELLDRTQFAIFQPNDGTLWNQIRAELTTFLNEFWTLGGLRGTRPQDAFYVRCDASLNTPTVIAEGRVLVEVGVALQYPAEFVVIRLGQFEGGSSTTES